MSWNVESTDQLDIILTLYREVFGEELPPAELKRREENAKLHPFVVRKGKGAPIGFGLFTGRGGSADFWHGGVVPASRNAGAGKALLDHAERWLAEAGYTRITATTYNRWNVMLSMLTGRGYRIYGTEFSQKRGDLKIQLHRELRPKRELRLSLTEVCNFKCFFCHMEGLDRTTVDAEDDTDQAFAVLQRAISLGHTDITFTGGEPLLRKAKLQVLLERLAALDAPPDVTVVTNGYHLDQDVIDFLCRYPSSLKVHVSLHASDAEAFGRITQTRAALFERVCANVRLATTAGLSIKINCVVLQGHNQEVDQLRSAVMLAYDLGAAGIKFLELLVIKDNQQLFGSYYAAHAIQRSLERGMPDLQRQPKNHMRKTEYLHPKDSRFLIEVQQLTCQLGCMHCRELRDRTISSRLQYHPCFVRTNKSFMLGDASTIDQAFADGDRLIDGFASTYGSSSPTLLRKEKYVDRKREYYFCADDTARFIDFLCQQHFQLRHKMGFYIEYYRPRQTHDDWLAFHRVLGLGQDHHDQSKAQMVYTDNHYDPVELDQNGDTVTVLATDATYLYETGPLRFETMQQGRRLLDRLGFERYHHRDWALSFYHRPASDEANELEVSISHGPRQTVKYAGSETGLKEVVDLLARYDGAVVPLTEPLMSYMTRSD